MDIAEKKIRLIAIVADRGLTSYMNNTRWAALCDAVSTELPFAPAFQEKKLDVDQPLDVLVDLPTFTCVWRALPSMLGGPGFGYDTEWVKVVPKLANHRGQLIPPHVDDCRDAFVAILRRLKVPFVEEGGVITIYGHASGVALDT